MRRRGAKQPAAMHQRKNGLGAGPSAIEEKLAGRGR